METTTSDNQKEISLIQQQILILTVLDLRKEINTLRLLKPYHKPEYEHYINQLKLSCAKLYLNFLKFDLFVKLEDLLTLIKILNDLIGSFTYNSHRLEIKLCNELIAHRIRIAHMIDDVFMIDITNLE